MGGDAGGVQVAGWLLDGQDGDAAYKGELSADAMAGEACRQGGQVLARLTALAPATGR